MPESSVVLLSKPRFLTAFFVSGLIVAATAAAAGDSAWKTQLTRQGKTVVASASDDGYNLSIADVDHPIPTQAAQTQTGSVLFDAMFALAQEELGKARVETIRYSAFDNNEPFACRCLIAGERWPWVWTRDIAYATDLGLFRFDPKDARNSLEFKLSGVREASGAAQPAKGRTARTDSALYPVQDTGSGGSWPVSTDRIVWFLGARHLTAEPAFAAKVYRALGATLAQDRRFAFDAQRGLYRGETSFLDWREQTYPAWTAHNVAFIAESYALSTNVLYYEALQLAAKLALARRDATSAQYREQAEALKLAIDRQFWREDRGLYMSYIGAADFPSTIEAYDLLGTSLAIVSGVAPAARARRALANYPTWSDGSPAVWPERHEVPVYHNRAMWPFASAYALKAARALDEPARIAHELRSILRSAALAGSNMENYELSTKTTHETAFATSNASAPDRGDFALPKDHAETASAPGVTQRSTPPDRGDFQLPGQAKPGAAGKSPPGAAGPAAKAAAAPVKSPIGRAQKQSNEPKRAGPVVNSRRQLWSIAAYLDLVTEGVFGLTDSGAIEPKLPRELVPMLFGEHNEIQLKLPDRRITLVLPAKLGEQDNLLIAATKSGTRADTRVQLRGTHVEASPLPLDRPAFAAETPAAPRVERDGETWRIAGSPAAAQQLYVNDRSVGAFNGTATLPYRRELQCISLTARSADGIESLPSQPVCVGETETVDGDWPRAWTAQHDGRYQMRLNYQNAHGPISTGITAAVKMLSVQCAGAPVQSAAVVMPHSEGTQQSTAVTFDARSGQRCTFSLGDGFNMTFLVHNAKFTGGPGGPGGPVNSADIGDLQIAKLH
ncbi:MAG TPA: hypothetical protein VGH81_02360 [Rudaea sp.]|jgi:hypothetical protein